MYRRILLLLTILIPGFLEAQNVAIKRHDLLKTPSFIRFSENAQPDFVTFNSILQKAVGNNFEWRVYNTILDELGQKHYRVQQYYKNIPLDFGVAVVHTFQGKIISINGELIPESLISGQNSISEEIARLKALKFLPATKYYWNSEEQNKALQQITGVRDTSYFPHGKLVWCPANFNYTSKHLLCYKFSVYAEEPLAAKTIYVNAQNGEILASEDIIKHTDVKGTAVTALSGTRPMMTDSTAPGAYRLREKSRGNGIETYNLKNGTSYGAAVDFTDADNYWNNVNAAKDQFASDAHWGAQRTWDFYDSMFKRNSFDDKGATIKSYIHYSSNYANAFWDGTRMTYGDGSTSSSLNVPLTALDVCGHEITHAVTTYSAGLVYSYESGALNESFSDVFGNSIEQWGRPNKWNWRIGEDITSTGNGIRSMANPNIFGNPKYYKGVSWYSGSGDNGGVHTNSGVQNYWYYLIAQGASGVNEKGNTFKIDTLGLVKAAKIAYRNLTVYLTKNSQYTDARTFSIMAATDLYGACSKEVINVTNAWWVCGVGPKYDSAYVKADFRSDTFACYNSKQFKFSNLSDNFVSCKWYFGDGSNSSSVNPTHTFPSYGNYTVKLVANSCFKNKKDSITKIAYIKIDSTKDICNATLIPLSGTDSVIKCKGFVYDDGGEEDYAPNNGGWRQTNLKITIPGADSIRYRFLLLDYENGFDSIVLFKTDWKQANKIGAFTGSTTPFGGAWKTIAANALWFRHYSDPYQEGKGFKFEFVGIRKPLVLDLGPDKTLCLGDSVNLIPATSGGYASDYRWKWSTGQTAPVITVKPPVQTKYTATLSDICTGLLVKDSITILLRPSLKVNLKKDTIVCNGNTVKLNATPSGGLALGYKYTWNNGLGNANTHAVTPLVTTNYRVILSDGCSAKSDTAFQTVFVKPALTVKITNSATLVCIGKTVNLGVTFSGGDTTTYQFNWNQGLMPGKNQAVVLKDTTTFKVTLSDGCSVKTASDSVALFTYPALSMQLTKDTVICKGSVVNLIATVSGGKGSSYSYNWSSGETSASVAKSPSAVTVYKVTGKDNCSPDVLDSVKVTLLPPLNLSKVTDTTLCDGRTRQVSLIPSGGKTAGHTITWVPAIISGFNPILNPGAGTTNYSATLTDGCTVVSDITNFKITRLAPLSAFITVSPGMICDGDSVKLNFVFAGGIPANYSWKLDGVPVVYKSNTIRPVLSSSYQLDLSDGCSVPAVSNASVTISPAANATLSAAPKTVCSDQQVAFTYTSTDAANVTWIFSNGDSSVGTGITLNKLFPKAGKYNAKARVVNSVGCAGVFDLVDTITSVAYPTVSFSANPDVADILNPTINFSDASKGADIYMWDFGDGVVSSVYGSNSHSYTDTGWFNTKLILSAGPGCISSGTKKVRIKDVFRLYIPSSFSPDENLVNDSFQPQGRGITKFYMAIYNRWGMLVYETSDINKPWTGKDEKGNKWGLGMYAVLIEIIDSEGYRHVEKRTINLLR